MVLAAASLPYAKKEGLGKVFVKNSDLKETIIASLVVIILGFSLFKTFLLYPFFGILLITFLLMAIFKRRIGGITGDNLGAINEIIEVVALLIIILGNSS